MRLPLAVSALLIVSPAWAASTGVLLPPIAQASVDSSAKDCDGAVSFEKGFVARKDVNGDGVDDYVLDFSHFVCGGSHTTYCGTAGCLMEVYVSIDGGYTKAFGENVQNMTFKKVGGRPAMLLEVHGSACGKAGFEQCHINLYWNGQAFSPAH